MFFTGLSNGCALWRHLSMTTKSASSPRNPILKQRIATMSAARSHPFPLHVVHELQNPKSGIFVAKQTKCPFPLIQNRYRSHSQSFLRLDRCWVQKKTETKTFFFFRLGPEILTQDIQKGCCQRKLFWGLWKYGSQSVHLTDQEVIPIFYPEHTKFLYIPIHPYSMDLVSLSTARIVRNELCHSVGKLRRNVGKSRRNVRNLHEITTSTFGNFPRKLCFAGKKIQKRQMQSLDS